MLCGGRQSIHAAGGRGFASVLLSNRMLPLAVAADEMAEADGVVDGGPAVRVDRDGVADGNACIEHAHLFIFEDEAMMLRGAAMTASSSGGQGHVFDMIFQSRSLRWGRPFKAASGLPPGPHHPSYSAGWKAGGSLERLTPLGLRAIDHSRECGGFADMLQAAHPRDETLDAHAEAGVRDAAVFA